MRLKSTFILYNILINIKKIYRLKKLKGVYMSGKNEP